MLHPTLRALAAVAMGPEANVQAMISCQAPMHLKQILSEPQKKRVLGNVCWVLANMIANGWETCEAVITEGIMNPVVEILKFSIYEVKKEAAYVIINAFTTFGFPPQVRAFSTAEPKSPDFLKRTVTARTVVHGKLNLYRFGN